MWPPSPGSCERVREHSLLTALCYACAVAKTTNERLPAQHPRRVSFWRGFLIFFGVLVLVGASIAAFFIYAASHW
jgi:hypothetical protein